MPVVVALLLLPLVTAAGSQPTSFVFPAAQERLDTGLWFSRGNTVEVNATGEWTMWAGHYGKSNANGHRFRAGLYGWGRLMARVGSGQEISIGTQKRFTASDSGPLFLYPNAGEYGVRGGAGELQITVLGGTPVKEVIARLSETGVRVTVPADQGLITDVFVEDDQTVSIDAFGEWRMFENGPLLTAHGDLKRFLADGTPWGRLVARFGGTTFATGETYAIGASRQVRPNLGGLLELQPAVGPYYGQQRTGSLEVVIRGARLATDRDRQRADRRAADVERTLGFLRIHQLRHALSLPVAFGDPALMRAAQSHAEYLARHGGGHEQVAEQPGFTGVTPAERAAAAGFRGEVAGELIHGYTTGQQSIDGLWSTVYHRVPLVDPAATAYGVGVAKGSRPYYVVVAGVPAVPPPDPTKVPEIATYPQDQQVSVPWSWSGLESPTALPADATGPVGYPISATLTRRNLTKVVKAELADRDGRPLPVWVIAPDRDPHRRLRASLFIVPRQPLEKQRTYYCAISVETDQGPLDYQWRFTTGLTETPLPVDVRLGNPSSPKVDLGRGEHGPGGHRGEGDAPAPVVPQPAAPPAGPAPAPAT